MGFTRVMPILLLAAAVFGDDEKCADCHSNPDHAKDGTAQVSVDAFAAGVHGKMECAECHKAPPGGFDVVPHELGGEVLPRCIRCHGKTLVGQRPKGAKDLNEARDEFRKGVHPLRMPDTFSCDACHDPHSMPREWPELGTPERTELANQSCLRCHRDADFRIAAKHGGGTPPKTTHDWLPDLDKHARMRCVVCHTPIEGKQDHQILPKEQATRNCEACHSEDAPLVRKYLGEQERRGWITNPILFEQVYLPGTVRNRLADAIILALFGLTVVGVLLHGVLRAIAGAKHPQTPFEVERTYMYPVGLRIWHWTNAILMIVLAATGLRLHFGGRADPVLSFEQAFHVHNLVGVLLVVLGILYFIRNAITGNARQYLGKLQGGLAGLVKQTRYYLWGIFKGEPHPYHSTPQKKFNPLQQVSYLLIMYVAFPVLIVTGGILLFPRMLPDRMGDKPGVWWFATAHYLSACAIILFLLAHIYLATMGDKVGYLFAAMFTGWHKHHVPKQPAGGENVEPEADDTPEESG